MYTYSTTRQIFIQLKNHKYAAQHKNGTYRLENNRKLKLFTYIFSTDIKILRLLCLRVLFFYLFEITGFEGK